MRRLKSANDRLCAFSLQSVLTFRSHESKCHHSNKKIIRGAGNLGIEHDTFRSPDRTS